MSGVSAHWLAALSWVNRPQQDAQTFERSGKWSSALMRTRPLWSASRRRQVSSPGLSQRSGPTRAAPEDLSPGIQGSDLPPRLASSRLASTATASTDGSNFDMHLCITKRRVGAPTGSGEIGDSARDTHPDCAVPITELGVPANRPILSMNSLLTPEHPHRLPLAAGKDLSCPTPPDASEDDYTPAL